MHFIERMCDSGEFDIKVTYIIGKHMSDDSHAIYFICMFDSSQNVLMHTFSGND